LRKYGSGDNIKGLRVPKKKSKDSRTGNKAKSNREA
jgi:hypothetical protein